MRVYWDIQWTMTTPGNWQSVSSSRATAGDALAGLVAHHFNHVGIRNVIYDIAAVPLDEFIDAENKWLTRTLRYGFPVTVRDGLGSLRRFLSEQGCQVFDIRASVGLCGFVIAQRLIIEQEV